jgi:hypothetical protein
MGQLQDLSEEYLIHQAREFHNRATKDIEFSRSRSVISNLAVSLEYLIELEEKRQGQGLGT